MITNKYSRGSPINSYFSQTQAIELCCECSVIIDDSCETASIILEGRTNPDDILFVDYSSGSCYHKSIRVYLTCMPYLTNANFNTSLLLNMLTGKMD